MPNNLTCTDLRMISPTGSSSGKRQNIPIDITVPLCQHLPMMSGPQNQFSLARAVSMNRRDARGKFLPITIVISLFVLASNLRAQDASQYLSTTAFEDVAEVKRKAEAGDASSQYKLANLFTFQTRSADALKWYLKAAHQGDPESAYQVGRLLLYGSAGMPQDQAVAANPSEGIRIVFRAAKQGHRAAIYDMYRAYKEGRAVAKDIVQAYAWLQFEVNTSVGLLGSPHKYELNQLALQVDVATSQEGKRLAALYRSGKWPELVAPAPKAPPKPSLNLRLSAIAPGQNPIACINGKVLAVGETATIPTKPQSCVLKCLRIDKDSVLVILEGETEPRELHFK